MCPTEIAKNLTTPSKENGTRISAAEIKARSRIDLVLGIAVELALFCNRSLPCWV
jgi:hypothetical protein